ncbi:hypothetical protein GBA52_004154 [Prunus armeniaca]|nr:hypothetical protein GBA52_004154 [Prunus armeniaca]
MQEEQEDRMVRKEDGRLSSTKTPLLIQGYAAGQTSGHAQSAPSEMAIKDPLRSSYQVDQPTGFNVTTLAPHMPKVISPPKEVASQHFTSFGTPSKYQAPKTGEPALPPEPIRRNMHADRWREPAGFNVHIAHNNGNNRGNGRETQNNAQVPEQIQESDDEEDAGQAPPAGAEPAPRNHPDIPVAGAKIDEQLIHTRREIDRYPGRMASQSYRPFSPRKGPNKSYEAFRRINRKVADETSRQQEFDSTS